MAALPDDGCDVHAQEFRSLALTTRPSDGIENQLSLESLDRGTQGLVVFGCGREFAAWNAFNRGTYIFLTYGRVAHDR
jgi:hypothetical protein